ncbi:hypothetical protein SAMN05880566_102200 [Janthinobacterium sp. TND4EL3]|jgi:hypothetical protein|uniref:hypothetical protein n=1 Tax=Janthinobacterium sp. TND4EL3 TaxID=1907311 RepID=UPI000954232A|nr:hypothetical protein [Janthinobacterium sp. TND4EL3]SIQ21131.1 hypothetical protein SAMN05880566_102200 [Janthinobacterium sp. TND4EL3]
MARVEPDRAALQIAHSLLRSTWSLDDMLKVPSLKLVLYVTARRHMKRRERFDPKKMQANDND